jgi:hypothetical protein
MTTARLARPDAVSKPLLAALGRYRTAFPDEALPFLRGVQLADQPVVAALLDLAVAMGQPLPPEGIMHTLGYLEPLPEAHRDAPPHPEPCRKAWAETRPSVGLTDN